MWEQIRYNQTRSAILIAGMGVLVLLLFLAICIALGGMFFLDTFESCIAGVILASITWLAASQFAYNQGDDMLLMMTGARKISPADHPRLYNIVEELKIASGLEKMPSLYVVEDPALNAFAIGCHPNKSAVIVTSGLLIKLNRDELQGVIGHEMAHIKNRDVMLISLCIMLLDLITVVVWLLLTRRALARTDFAPEIRGWRIMLFGFSIPTIAAIVILSIGQISELYVIIVILYIWAFMLSMPTVAHLIYYATSRRREYLADASSALYTRYPEGLASALEKIAASTDQVLAASPATAPIYIINPFRSQGLPASDITSTHPSISERIRILRFMSHVSYADYDRAYRQIRNIDKGIIPATAMAAAGATLIRAAVAEDLDYIQRARETSNVLWNLNKYKIINCACGTRLRLPPSFKLPEVKCPHCGRINPV